MTEETGNGIVDTITSALTGKEKQSEYFKNKNNIYRRRKIYKGDPEENMMKGKDIVYAPSQREIVAKGIKIKDTELRALYFYLYLTGARISEALKLKYGDIVIKPTTKNNKHRYAEVRCITLKNKMQALRTIAIPLHIPIEAQMYAYFDELYEHRVGNIFKEQTSRNNVWYKFHSGSDKIEFETDVMNFKARKIEKQVVKMHPHLLRHFRLSHLVTLYDFNPFQLQQFAGWSDIKPASIYVSLGSGDIAGQFGKKSGFDQKPFKFEGI